MPSSIALCTTRLVAAKSMRPPKLLPPSPTMETSSADAPSLRLGRGIRSLGPREAENVASLVGCCDLPTEPARDARHALHQDGVVFGEFAGRHIGIVFVADANMSAER